VGAGIGGLICANLLARAGLSVLIVEQHYMIGGYCSTFRRNAFTFDAATHFYPLLGNPATITGRLLADLGMTTRWVKMDPVDHFHFPDGSTFSVPADFDRYLGRLKAEFHDEAGALDRFFAAAREAYLFGLLHYFRGVYTERLEPWRSLSLQQALDGHFRDRKLKLLLAADCGHWGSPPSRTSFVFDAMLRLAYFLGNYYPEGGSQAFADELARCLEEKGGHILMRSLVTRILVRDHTACGIEVETGAGGARAVKRVEAKVIVSNADLLLTLERLLGSQEVDPQYLESVRKLRPSCPCFLTHVGVRGIPTDVLREAQGYHWDSWDAERIASSAFKIFVPTLFEPAMAPPGGHVVIVQKLTDVDYDGVEDWSAHKASVERYIMANLERLIPGFSDRVVITLSASALTSYRYTLNHHGAMLGWEMSPEQLGERRPGTDGPVENLYLVGHWIQPGGGITPVIVSAMQVARTITQILGSGRSAADSPLWPYLYMDPWEGLDTAGR
jgi:phytoene dehydrogenase-like protein